MKVIGQEAFRESGLKSLTLASVDSIGISAFTDCPYLSNVSLNENIGYVWENIFNGTPLREINLYNARTYNGLYKYGDPNPDYITLFSDLPNLQCLSGTGVHYYRDTKRLPVLNTPGLQSIMLDSVYDFSLTGKNMLRQIGLFECKIDSLEIPHDLINGYLTILYPGDPMNLSPWYGVNLTGSAVDHVKIAEGNPCYFIRDSLLLTYRFYPENEVVYPDYVRPDTIFNPLYYDGVVAFWETASFTDTIALAAVGFPRGEWFVPKNNPYNGVTYCCDYVDKIRMTADFDPANYHLKTFTRPSTDSIMVYVDTPPSWETVYCCDSELMIFIVPRGMLGRYIAAGFPPERTREDDGSDAIEVIEQDKVSPYDGKIYTIDGRLIPEGTRLTPGIYIIDGKKYYLR